MQSTRPMRKPFSFRGCLLYCFNRDLNPGPPCRETCALSTRLAGSWLLKFQNLLIFDWNPKTSSKKSNISPKAPNTRLKLKNFYSKSQKLVRHFGPVLPIGTLHIKKPDLVNLSSKLEFFTPGQLCLQDVRAPPAELLRALRFWHPRRLRPQAVAPRGQPLTLSQLWCTHWYEDQVSNALWPTKPGRSLQGFAYLL